MRNRNENNIWFGSQLVRYVFTAKQYAISETKFVLIENDLIDADFILLVARWNTLILSLQLKNSKIIEEKWGKRCLSKITNWNEKIKEVQRKIHIDVEFLDFTLECWIGQESKFKF